MALSGAEEAGTQTEMVDLRDYRVIFDGKTAKGSRAASSAIRMPARGGESRRVPARVRERRRESRRRELMSLPIIAGLN